LLTRLETQSYVLIDKRDGIELREYPSVMKIQSRAGFGSLFRYISRGNRAQQQIPMTTPVYMGDSEGNELLQFVLPKEFTPAITPASADDRVEVFQAKPGFFLAKRFSGFTNPKKKEKNVRAIRSLANLLGLNIIGEPIVLVYNSPYRLLFRKNEVIMEIEPALNLHQNQELKTIA